MGYDNQTPSQQAQSDEPFFAVSKTVVFEGDARPCKYLLGILKAEDVEDSHVVRVPKTYPAYFGSYDRFDVIRRYLDGIENLFLVGRNGMHKYNNQDHAMMTAMLTARNILAGQRLYDVWNVNEDAQYHEAGESGVQSALDSVRLVPEKVTDERAA